MAIDEISSSANVRTFLFSRSRMRPMIFVFYSCPCGFFGDSSHSSPFIEETCRGKPVIGVLGGASIGRVGAGPRLLRALSVGWDTCRRKPNVRKLVSHIT